MARSRFKSRTPINSDPEFDKRMMLRALSLARRGEGRVEPNPMVGCVIARGRRILGDGYHRKFGGPHAEIEALRACRSDPKGATAYVTLEPCCHHGKTPPCVDALTQAGISRVVVAVRDPNPLVDGGGIAALRHAGIQVDIGVCESEAREVLAPFLTHVVLRRPYVIAKWAQSLDGKMATHTGDSKWVSGEESRRLVHRLRARVDVILAGIGTVLHDDPTLTARDVPIRRIARRIVLDAHLRIPLRCNLVRSARQVPVTVLTTKESAASRKAGQLARAGVAVHACRVRKGRLSLRDCLRTLVQQGVTNLMVEGGPSILSSFLDEGFIDVAWVFTAPIFLGSRAAPGPFDGATGAAQIAAAIRPRRMRVRRVGDDSFHRMWLTDPPGACG